MRCVNHIDRDSILSGRNIDCNINDLAVSRENREYNSYIKKISSKMRGNNSFSLGVDNRSDGNKSSDKKVYIGIDPGYAITGYGIITKSGNDFKAVDYGVISTKPEMPFEERLLAINTKVQCLLEVYKPNYMAIEELFLSQNKTTAIGTAQARGVVIVEAARANIPVYEFTPGQIKLAVTGYGKADKKQVSQMVKSILHLEEIPKPDDACDGLAVAICLANTGVIFAERAVSGYQYGRYGKRDFV